MPETRASRINDVILVNPPPPGPPVDLLDRFKRAGDASLEPFLNKGKEEDASAETIVLDSSSDIGEQKFPKAYTKAALKSTLGGKRAMRGAAKAAAPKKARTKK